MILANTVSSDVAGQQLRGDSGPTRGARATVTVSQLAIDFTASVATVTPGGTVRYVATLHNTGQTPYFGISVATDATGIADDATSNGDETASLGDAVGGADRGGVDRGHPGRGHRHGVVVGDGEQS